MTGGPVYIDTNVLIDMTEDREEAGESLRSFVLQCADVSPAIRLVTSELTLSEALVKPYRNDLTVLIQFYTSLRRGTDWLEILPVRFEALALAAKLRASMKALRLPDAIHVAMALSANCSRLLTNDLGISDIQPLTHPLTTELMQPLKVSRADAGSLSALFTELNHDRHPPLRS